LSTRSFGGKFNIFILDDDLESPLGYLLPSDKRKVEVPSNHLLKYGGDRWYNMHAVSFFCSEIGIH